MSFIGEMTLSVATFCGTIFGTGVDQTQARAECYVNVNQCIIDNSTSVGKRESLRMCLIKEAFQSVKGDYER